MPEAASRYDLRQPPDDRRASANPGGRNDDGCPGEPFDKRRTGTGMTSTDEVSGLPKVDNNVFTSSFVYQF